MELELHKKAEIKDVPNVNWKLFVFNEILKNPITSPVINRKIKIIIGIWQKRKYNPI